jgi:hypothetical protein
MWIYWIVPLTVHPTPVSNPRSFIFQVGRHHHPQIAHHHRHHHSQIAHGHRPSHPCAGMITMVDPFMSSTYFNRNIFEYKISIESYLNTILKRIIRCHNNSFMIQKMLEIYTTSKYLKKTMVFSNFHIEIKKKRTNNTQTSFFLIITPQYPYYHSLYVSLYVCVYVFVSHERGRVRIGMSQSPSYNRIEDYYYT